MSAAELKGELSEEQISELSKETIINSFLGVAVVRGKPKETALSGKLHNSFETTIRILPFEQLKLLNLDEFDQYAYEALSEVETPFIAKPFDAYRTLKNELKAVKGFPHIEAVFPKTHLLGIEPKEGGLRDRAAWLNRWMGVLLSGYSEYPPEAKALIDDFLELDCVDANKHIIPMLSKTFSLPKLRVWPPPHLAQVPVFVNKDDLPPASPTPADNHENLGGGASSAKDTATIHTASRDSDSENAIATEDDEEGGAEQARGRRREEDPFAPQEEQEENCVM